MKKSAESAWRGNPYKRPGSPFWSVVFTDASGIVRRKSTKTRDLRIARDFLADRLREVELQKTGHVDRYAETRTRPIGELVNEYRDHLAAKGCAQSYLKDTLRQLRQWLSFCKVTTVPNILVPDAERFLEDLATKRSRKTRDNTAGAMRSFGGWLRRTGRWETDPLHGIQTHTATKDKHRTYKRVGLRYEEAERLVDAAMARFLAEKVLGGTPSHKDHVDTVRDRQVLYWFVLTVGFRAKECSSLLWEDLTLDGEKPCVRLSGKHTKNGDDAFLPLQRFVADALIDMRQRRSAARVRRGEPFVQQTDKVFTVPRMIARLVRKDAAYAGLIPQRSPTSRRVDFHCLRKSCARILIELGLHPKVIQATLRHSDIRLTMDLYGELGEDDLFRELPGRFPVPKLFAAPGDGGAPTTVATSSSV